MPAQQENPGIVADVEQQRADAALQHGVALEVTASPSTTTGCTSWSRPGVRASDHANLMAQIECGFKRRGIRNVPLVPALSD